MLTPREVVVCTRPARLLAGLVLCGLLGCAHQPTTTSPPATSPPATSPPAAAPPAAAPPSTPATSPVPGPKAAAAAPAPGTAARAPAPKPAPASTARAASSPAAPRTSPAAPTSAAATPSPPPAALDLASLEQRLRDTHAIGVFTKLSLKNQVDDLLAQFRAFYAGQGGLTLAGLRRSYELLLMKVVTLLQDDDPGLASAVSSSREPIWAILSDRNRFNNL
jgi:hypothetical protein